MAEHGADIAHVLALRWMAISHIEGFNQVSKEGATRMLYYASSRDISAVLRHCIPCALQLCKAMYEATDEDMKHVRKVVDLCACGMTLPEGDVAGADDIVFDLLADETSMLWLSRFSTAFMIVLPLYIAGMPHLARTMQGTWPDMGDQLMQHISAMSLTDPEHRRRHLGEHLQSMPAAVAKAALELNREATAGYLDRQLKNFGRIVNTLIKQIEHLEEKQHAE